MGHTHLLAVFSEGRYTVGVGMRLEGRWDRVKTVVSLASRCIRASPYILCDNPTITTTLESTLGNYTEKRGLLIQCVPE
jgi:hypothetical protein